MCGEQHKSFPFTLLTNFNVFNEVLAMVAAYPWQNNLTGHLQVILLTLLSTSNAKAFYYLQHVGNYFQWM